MEIDTKKDYFGFNLALFLERGRVPRFTGMRRGTRLRSLKTPRIAKPKLSSHIDAGSGTEAGSGNPARA
jgi:hypothetical protein